MLKKFIAISFLNILLVSNVNAGYGKGELKLTENAVRGFYKYLTDPKGSPGRAKPLRMVVSHNGSYVHWFYCAHTNCVSDGDSQLVSICERKQANPCSTFAVGRSVKWKNGINQGGKSASFKKKMSLDEVKEKLTNLGFYEPRNSKKSKPKTQNYIKKKSKQTNKDSSKLVSQLENLNKLYKSGVLTKEEFETAKKKLLN
jgi:hypothetical protein